MEYRRRLVAVRQWKGAQRFEWRLGLPHQPPHIRLLCLAQFCSVPANYLRYLSVRLSQRLRRKFRFSPGCLLKRSQRLLAR